LSVFENGQFTQTLGMSRYMNQDNPSNVITRSTKQQGPAGADAQTGAWDGPVNTGGVSA
jgi:hypothetical protein